MRPLRAAILATTLALLPLHVAEASLMQVVLEGSIDRADPGNKLGVAAGDMFTVTFELDPSEARFSMGGASVWFSQPTKSTLLIRIGRFQFNHFDDEDFGDGGPQATFDSNLTRVTSFSFRTLFGGQFGDGDPFIDDLDIFGSLDFPGEVTLIEDLASDQRRTTVQGRLNFVPEPTQLLGLGLALLAWRRRAATRSTAR